MPNVDGLPDVRDTQPALLGSRTPDRELDDQPAHGSIVLELRSLTRRQPTREHTLNVLGRTLWAGVLGEEKAQELIEETHRFIADERAAGRKF